MTGRQSVIGDGILNGRVALVTGGSRGIGLAVARSLLQHGAAVVINGRDADTVADAVRQLRGGEGEVEGVAGPADDPKVLSRMLGKAHLFGPPDTLVTCTGIAEPPGSSILDISLDDWDELIRAHLRATFVACRVLVPGMVSRGRGCVITTSSHAFTGMFGGTGYAAAKGGVCSLTYALAAELAEHGVRVNAVCPGARTRLSSGDEYEQTIAQLHARGLLDDLMRDGALSPASPDYVAELYAFLASDLAQGITGQVFSGAGGYVGRFDAPAEKLIAYRDHAVDPPWTPVEIARQLIPDTQETS